MFDKCIILGLDKRKDLWTSLREDCLKRGFDTEVFIVGDGSDVSLKYDWIDTKVVTPPNWQWGTNIQALRHYKAHLSHKMIIRKAIKNKYSNILLMEDDAIILPRIETILPSLWEYLQDISWDFFYLGWHCWEYENDKPVGRNILVEDQFRKDGQFFLQKTDRVGGFHAVVINKSAFIPILNMPEITPLDNLINCSDFYNRYICIPKVVDVLDTFSYCENRFVSRR